MSSSKSNRPPAGKVYGGNAMNGSKSFLLSVLLVVSVLCSLDALATDKLTMSSTNPTALEIDQMVARDKGFFARDNIDLDVTYMQPDLVIKALIAGTVDLARSGSHFGMIAASRGAEIKIIGGSTY